MKWIFFIVVLMIFETTYATECGAFVGHWEGQCHADDQDGIGPDFDYDIEISKLSACEGFHFLGQDIYFNKMSSKEWNKGAASFTKHSLLRWVEPKSKNAVEIFNSVIETLYTAETKEIAKITSYRNNFVLERIAEGKLAMTVMTQKDFQPGERYVCTLGLRN